jgi:hypothetical protein
VSPDTGVTGQLTIDNIFALLSVSGSAGLRVRLYKTDTDMENDVSRPFSSLPPMSAGVLYDGVLSNDLVFPYLLIQTENGLVYYRVQNTTASPISSKVVFSYFTYEAASFIPKGYLPRHYKFSRDNGTALKRRNYLGCRDIDVTFDNQSPVVVSVSNANTIIVNSTTALDSTGTGTVNIPENETGIGFGGGGTLDITG